MNESRVYLIYYDIGNAPTDMDELHIAWTEVAYYAKLRAKMIMQSMEGTIDRSKIKIVPFHSVREMEQFLSEFDMSMLDTDLEMRRLYVCQSVSAITPGHTGIWTEEEIQDGIELIVNMQSSGGVREIRNTMDILSVAAKYFQNPNFSKWIESLWQILYKYVSLYVLREEFAAEIEDVALGEEGTPPEDFCRVRDAFKQEFGLDIVTSDIDDQWFGVLDTTELLIRFAMLPDI